LGVVEVESEGEFPKIDRNQKKETLPAPLRVFVPFGSRHTHHEDIHTSHLDAPPGFVPSEPASAAKNREEEKDDDDAEEGVVVELVANQPPIEEASTLAAPPRQSAPPREEPWAARLWPRRSRASVVRRMASRARSW